jgi:DNA-binding NarL/FixJ family response regulator
LIRLEIIADRKSTADDLAHLLAFDERLEVVAAGAIGSLFRQSTAPDVLLLVKLLESQLPLSATPMVALSDDTDVLPPGVHAWLPLQSSPAAIVAALIAAAAGLHTLTSDQIHLFTMRNPMPRMVEKLTARELEVLNLMAEGFGNKQIAAHLHISGHTAKFHVAQILAKLRAGTRTEAVRIAIRRGLIAL